MRLPLVFFIIVIVPYNCRAQEASTAANPGYEAAQKLTSFRRQLRKTIDGRLCAAAFVYDAKTYTDCTDERGPDGTSGREWCFVEVSLLGKGPKDWNFCVTPITYDKVRAKIRETFEIKFYEVQKMAEQLDREVQRLENMKQRYNMTCGAQHESTAARLSTIASMTLQSRHCVEKIEETVSNIEMLQGIVSQTKDDLRKNRKLLPKQAEYCAVVPGYEDEASPDGLLGAYYNNLLFEGPPKAFHDDENVNVVFAGKTNIDGISLEKLSIRWTGFILAPHTENYIFSTETTCGARVFLNNKAIIVDRMPQPLSMSEADDETPVPIVDSINRKAGIQKFDSPPQQLIGGQKYKIHVEMIHSSHLLNENSHELSMKLLWRSPNISEQVIPKKYFFKSNSRAPFKVSGLDANNFEITILFNGVSAYKDDLEHLIADLPERYEGRKMIRTVQPLTTDRFTIELNSPAVVYVASAVHESLPIVPMDDQNFQIHKTGDYVFVHKRQAPLTRAVSSTVLCISFFEVQEGGKIYFQVLKENTPFILFLEPRKETGKSCGGEEEVLSISDGPYFESCEASSELSRDYGCKSALNGKLMDQKNGVWRTTGGNGVGQYIIVKFKRDVQITKFRFKPRDDEIYWPSEITLSFTEESKEDRQIFSIKHINSITHNTFELKKPVITSYVKIEITQMYTKLQNTGGSFELVGSHCNSNDQLSEGKLAYQQVYIENCYTTAENTPEILPLKDGEKFLAVCPHSCILFPEGHVFGIDYYSPASSICAAAVHANVCGKLSSDPCKVWVTILGPKQYFKRGYSNGIFSNASGPQEVSLTFSSAPELFEDPTADTYLITFQNENSLLRKFKEYYFDFGGVKSTHGQVSYGWARLAKVEDCPSTSNPLYGGGVSFSSSVGSWDCDTQTQNCDTNFWSISLPEGGNYHVEIQVGSDCLPAHGSRMYYLQVNGKPLISAVPLKKGEYYWVTFDIELTANKMMLTSICDVPHYRADLCINATTTLLNVKLQKLG